MATKEMVEVRWHGRGGQGAKTAALLFADAALATGKYIQAFPEYGPERMGAPVQSFNRISDKAISIHCGITEPNYVVVLDPTLMDCVSVAEGLSDGGKVIVNTSFPAVEIAKRLNLSANQVFVVDASKIAQETIGLNIPNTPMLGALIKVIGTMNIEHVLGRGQQYISWSFKPPLWETP